MIGLSIGLDLSSLLRANTMKNVSTASAVSAIPDGSLKDGELIFVSSFRDYFALSKVSTNTANGITTLATLSGVGRWERQNFNDQIWGKQAAWYLDPTNGNDEYDGTSATFTSGLTGPIKTCAEFERRIGVRGNVAQLITLNLLGSLPGSDPLRITFAFGAAGGLRIVGKRTTVASGTFTAVTAIAAASNQPQEVTDTAQASWASYVNMRLRITSGTRSGATAWVAKSMGSNKIRTSPFCAWSLATFLSGGALTVVSPVVGDPYTVETLSTIASVVWDFSNAQAGSGNYSNSPVSFEDCALSSPTITLASPGQNAGTVALLLMGCDIPGLSGVGNIFTLEACRVSSSLSGPSIFALDGCLWTTTALAVAGAQIQLGNHTLIQGTRLRIRRGGLVYSASNGFCIMDSTSQGMGVENGGIFRGSGPLYGSGQSAQGIYVASGGQACYTSGSRPTVTGTGGDFELGPAAPATGVRVFDDSTGAWSSTKVPTTYANLAAARPTGFGDYATNPVGGATLCLTEY